MDYPHDTAAPAALLLESKLIFNSTISTPGAHFMSADIKDYFLNRGVNSLGEALAVYDFISVDVVRSFIS